MSNNKKLVPENLDEEQVRTLNKILNLIIPPSKNRKMPGAADVGFLNYAQKEYHLHWIREGLINIIEESHNKYGQEFSEISSSVQKQLIDKLRRRFPQFFNRLTAQLMYCYYQHDDVLKVIGLEARAPFPEGYRLEDDDLSLLEQVYLSGKIYKG